MTDKLRPCPFCGGTLSGAELRDRPYCWVCEMYGPPSLAKGFDKALKEYTDNEPTLRDLVAMAAFQGLLANGDWTINECATMAYGKAVDAMLKAREGE